MDGYEFIAYQLGQNWPQFDGAFGVFIKKKLGYRRLMKEYQQKAVEYYIQSYNHFDVDGMVRDMRNDIIFENITNDNVDLRTTGITEFKVQAEKAKQFFSERKQTIFGWDFQGDTVTIEINYEGVLAIDLPGGAMKGDTLELNGTSEFCFHGSKIISLIDRS